MAKLDITAVQIQSTTNMLTHNASLIAEDWATDSKYPSANAAANLVTTTTNAIIEACENTSGSVEYPIGSAQHNEI